MGTIAPSLKVLSDAQLSHSLDRAIQTCRLSSDSLQAGIRAHAFRDPQACPLSQLREAYTNALDWLQKILDERDRRAIP